MTYCVEQVQTIATALHNCAAEQVHASSEGSTHVQAHLHGVACKPP